MIFFQPSQRSCMRQIDKRSEILMPARPRSGICRSFIVWIQLKKCVLISLVPRGVAQECGHTFPGFIVPSGPITPLIVFIKATVPSPSSSTKNSFPIQTPCSPVPEKTDPWVSALHGLASHDAQDFQVPSSANARLTMRGTGPRTAWSSLSVLKAKKVWKFPSVP